MFPKLDKSMIGMDFNKVWLELSGDSFPSNLETIEAGYPLLLGACFFFNEGYIRRTLDYIGRQFRYIRRLSQNIRRQASYIRRFT
ncbi:hypothetical protein [Cytobacillus massiliigabonensis]|uniref:hypothetical protein n=1 Tax=Cytobacillus massiliigabonensis TaxID=1871011 RepID=UPI002AC3507D|nr:hypothetical protein [Cytobacillus massiliigabonensis]